MRQRSLFRVLLVSSASLALLSARPFAGGWNDSSRLATVESLVDRGTFQIDNSIYVQPSRAARPPFQDGVEFFATNGTKDKMRIEGHFYSDKSPVPAVLMAGAYQVLSWCGLHANERPDWFARVLTWLFAGIPYVFAVWCVARSARHLGVQPPWKLLLTASFAFGSLATCYVQHVNNHILLLGVAAGLCEALTRPSDTGFRVPRLIWVGTLAGLAYTIDLGAGPLLTASIGCYVLWQRLGVFPFILSALPWILAHHAFNYAIAGSFAPGNARPEYFDWPGSPFHSTNMTGAWNHSSPWKAGLYALDLMWGKKGFLLFTLPLVQAVFGTYWLIRRSYPGRPIVVAFGCWAIGTWLIYAATSRNLSGACQSIRWFVPLLIPGYLGLMILVRDYPRSRPPLAVLVVGGLILSLELIVRGPWSGRVPILLWPVMGVALGMWIATWIRAIRDWRRVKRRGWEQGTEPAPPAPSITKRTE